MNIKRLPVVLLLLVLMGWCAPAGFGNIFSLAEAAILVVQNSNDSGAGSLRQAVADASSGDVIIFDSDAVIRLSAGIRIEQKDLTIDGNGHSVTISGNGQGFGPVFDTGYHPGGTPTPNVTLRGLAMVKGSEGIYNLGILTVENCTISGHRSGIYNWAETVTVRNSTISDNSGGSCAGGIESWYGTVTVEGCTISGNSTASSTYGGGITSYAGILTVRNSTIFGNAGPWGGGIYHHGNSGGDALTLINVTVSGNTGNANHGGGIRVTGGALTLRNTIIANNNGVGKDCVVDNNDLIVENTNNLVGDGSCSDKGVNFQSGDPLLGPLADNGGPTLTTALLPGSPAIDAADVATATDTDQRGSSAVGARDIGAFEYTGLYTLTYTAGAHGSITGVSPQMVNEGGSGTAVTAVPDPGYRFLRWSDGSAANPRTDSSVKANNSVTARFFSMPPIVVQNSNDSGPGSLRQAIEDASPWDMITFDSDAVINLSSVLAISKDLAIDANGHSVTLSGDTNNDDHSIDGVSVFNISAGHDVTLRSLRIARGYSNSTGGGILNAGTLTVEDCTFQENTSNYTHGGGIYNTGTLTVKGCTFSSNFADQGSGIYNAGGALTVRNSTFYTNHGSSIYSNASLTRPLTLINTTLNASAIYVERGALTFRNTIIANTAGVDCNLDYNKALIAENTNNLVGNGSCSDKGVNFHSGNPLLGRLADNGGPTPTTALLPGSPAIDAADVATATDTDQRGISRVGAPDIGAYENDGLTLSYTAGAHGSITGFSPQTVNEGGSGTAVTAAPDPGYGFVRWSDGSTANPRADSNVTGNIMVTARFSNMTPIVVQNSNDSGPGSLRQAIADASPWDTITFDSDAVITLSSELAISKDLTIDGNGHDVTLSGDTDNDGSPNVRIFNISCLHDVTLRGLSITKGGGSGFNGGGIFNAGSLTVENCTISHNSVMYIDDELHGWIIGGQAGAIRNTWLGTLTVRNSTISANSANDFNGGIVSSGPLTLINVTMAGNSCPGSGGNDIRQRGSTLTLRNTIIASTGGHACIVSNTFNLFDDPLVENTNNLVQDGSCSDHGVNFHSGNPLLGPLADNGGPTPTMALLAGSPAIDAADATKAPSTDQRGYFRAGAPDIGAFEYGGATAYTLTYSAGAGGSISGSSTQTVNEGGSGTPVTAVADTGYHFVRWSDNSTANPRTDTNVTADISVTAEFAGNTHTLTYTAGAHGSITGSSPQTVNYGGSGTTVTAVADTGYHFVKWSDNSTANPRTDTNVTADISVTAELAIDIYTVTPSAGINGSMSPSAPQGVAHGLTTSFTVSPDTGYRISTVSGCGGTLSGATFTTGAVTVDCTVTATFVGNAAPVASADSYDVDLGQTVTVSPRGVLRNDTDADDVSLSAVLVSGPAHGVGIFTLNADGGFIYHHDGTSTGNDSFAYKARDPWGGESAATTVTLALHTQSEADTDLSVSPSSRLFGVEELNNCSSSTPVLFTVKNSGTASRTPGPLELDGPNADELSLGTDGCSGQTLTSGATCTVEVKFCPKTVGSKAATLLIPSDDPETPVLTAFLHNHEARSEEAWRRLPPILYSLSVPEVMSAGGTYTLAWSLLGYDVSYQSSIVFFDCTGITDGSCGADYNSRFAESTPLTPDSSENGDWTYNGVRSKKFNFGYSFQVPGTRAGGAPWSSSGTDIVIRFYSKDEADLDAGKGSLSLLVPGNLSSRYYDSEGRRILRTIIQP